MEASDIQRLIEKAWADISPPNAATILSPGSCGEEFTTEYFAGTNWRGHKPADLRGQSSAFTFFSPTAWHYWLPAFLLAAMYDPDEADVCFERIAESMYDEYSDERVPLLKPAQREALAAYFEFQINQFPNEDTTEQKNALVSLSKVT